MITQATGADGIFYGYENDYIFECIKKCGRFSPTEIVFLDKLLLEGDNVIEIGSNIGSHTIPFAKKIKSGKCFVFEPQLDIYQILLANLFINQIENVISYPVGLGDSYRIIYYKKNKLDSNTGGFSLLRKNDNHGESFFKITPINQEIYPELYCLPSLKLIKIDVEGMELIILNQLSFILQKYNPYVFVEYNRYTYKEIINFAYDNNYIPYLFNTSCAQYGLEDKICDINIFLAPENEKNNFGLQKLDKNSNFMFNIKINNIK